MNTGRAVPGPPPSCSPREHICAPSSLAKRIASDGELRRAHCRASPVHQPPHRRPQPRGRGRACGVSSHAFAPQAEHVNRWANASKVISHPTFCASVPGSEITVW